MVLRNYENYKLLEIFLYLMPHAIKAETLADIHH